MPLIFTDGRRVKRPIDPRYEALFSLIADLRAPAIAHLHSMFFKPVLGVHLSSAHRRITRLQEQGLLRGGTTAGTPRAFVHLTEKGWRTFPSISERHGETVFRTPTREAAAFGWQRAALRSALVDDGYTVGRDFDALLALRRYLVDATIERAARLHGAERFAAEHLLRAMRSSSSLTPLYFHACRGCRARTAIGATPPSSCNRCARPLEQVIVRTPWACRLCGVVTDQRVHDGCDGSMRPQMYLPYDLAHRVKDGRRDVIVVLVDNPYRSIANQLEELPLRFLDQPRIKVIVRPAEDGSVWDEDEARYSHIGPRLRQLLHAFTAHDRPRHFPYWKSADVITYRPELAVRTRTRRRA